jgi:hypothetical protein
MGNKTAPGPIAGNQATLVRAVAAADTPPLIDTNCDPTTALITSGWRAIRVFLRFTGGTSPTASVQVLHRMLSVTGNGWVPGPLWGALSDGEAMDLHVAGRDVFFAVPTITGAPSNVAIYVAGWDPVYQSGGPYR